MERAFENFQEMWSQAARSERWQRCVTGWRSLPPAQRGSIVTLLAAFGGLMLWHWPLAIALIAGVLATAVGLVWHEPGGRTLRRLGSDIWHGAYGGMMRALTLGAIVVLGTYALSSAWASAQERWLVLGIWLQAIATLSILAILAWEALRRRQERSQRIFDSLLRDLGSPKPLRRLAAARNLQHHFPEAPTHPQQLRLGVDYLRMVLQRESVPEVREALLDNLQAWGFNPNLANAAPVSCDFSSVASADMQV